MNYKITVIITFFIFMISCIQLPKAILPQWEQKVGYEVDNDSLRIQFNNPLNCPIRIYATSSDNIIQEKLAVNFPVTINPMKDTLLTYWTSKSKDEIPIRFSALLGNPQDSVNKKEIYLPFKEGFKYEIIQGYNGSYSHDSEYSKCALDFNLA